MKKKVFDFFSFQVCSRTDLSGVSKHVISNILYYPYHVFNMSSRVKRHTLINTLQCYLFRSVHLRVDLCALKSLIFWSRHTYTFKLTLGKLSFIQFNALNVQVKIHIRKGVENVGVSSCLKYEKKMLKATRT